jgi:hypothetical protein
LLSGCLEHLPHEFARARKPFISFDACPPARPLSPLAGRLTSHRLPRARNGCTVNERSLCAASPFSRAAPP